MAASIEKSLFKKQNLYLWWHAVTHDGVVEGLSLPSVEAEDFDVSSDSSQKWRQRSILLRALPLAADVTPIAAALDVVVLLVEVVVSLLIICYNIK